MITAIRAVILHNFGVQVLPGDYEGDSACRGAGLKSYHLNDFGDPYNWINVRDPLYILGYGIPYYIYAKGSFFLSHTTRLQSSRDEWQQLSPHWGTWSIAPTDALVSRPLSRVYRTAAIMTPTAKLHAGFDDPDKCLVCGGQDSIQHLLLECPPVPRS